ncbi:MAG TPA: ATP-binding cassette domain-containing protein [Terriglobales bacterium]|nr:ATP-binding cassette domain-containing protein [Terriglobales bacterium]
MLKISGLEVAIQAVTVLRDVRLELPTGAIAGLIGRNGAGKTSLMRSIMGLLPPRRGSVEFNGMNLAQVPPHGRTRAGIGYMPEDRRLIPELTAEENILLPAWAMDGAGTPERLKTIYQQIPELEQMAGRKALQLSGGQQKLVALGRALMCGTRLLLLDEPFEGVAPALAQRISEAVAGLRQEGMSILISESDLQHSARMLDRVFRIERGQVTQQGEPS